MKKAIRILHLEDSIYDAELVQSMLESAGISCSVTRVDSARDFSAALENSEFDMILSDYSLPSFDGLSALALAREKVPDVPFIFVSAAMGEERAIDSLKRGATDYVLKQRLSRLVLVVRRVLHEVDERVELGRAEKALRENEQKLRTIVESSQDLIWEIDKDGQITFTNSSVESILGYSAPEVLGKKRLHYLHEGNKREFEPTLLQNTLSQKRGWTGLVSRWQHKDGSYRWMESNATPILNEKGELTGFRGVDRDITERKKSEEKLRQSEEMFRLIMENMSDLIALVDLNGRRLYNSPSYQAILGDPKTLRGTDSFQEIHPGDQQRVKEIFYETVRTGIGRRAEFRLLGKDGSVRFIESQGSLVKNGEGKPTSVVVVSRDVTARKKLEEQLIQAQKMESIGTLAGGIAHDFNNVLAIMLGYTSILSKGAAEPEKLSKSTEAMTTAIHRGAGLVRQLLTFARKSEILFEPVNINETVQEVARMCSQTFPKRITFSTQLDNDLWKIIADRNQLHQALLNLCVNARDAMPNGGSLSIGSGTITGTEIRKQFPGATFEKYVYIELTDTGTGMDAATQARIFEPFFTTKGEGKGTGLGLAMVYSAVSNHHGFIDVKSEKGKGTTFRLCFPVLPAGSKSLPLKSEVVERVVGGTETILFAEDEETLVELVKALLEEKGYRVLVAKDGIEAIEAFKKHVDQISLVLTDIELPKLGGWDAFLEMKQIKPNIISIIATGYIDPESRSEMMKRGAKDFIEKPYAPNQLLKAIRDALDSPTLPWNIAES